MRRLHTANRRSRTATARLHDVLARTLPDAKDSAMRGCGFRTILRTLPDEQMTANANRLCGTLSITRGTRHSRPFHSSSSGQAFARASASMLSSFARISGIQISQQCLAGHTAEDRNAAVASGIGGLQSAANFGDEIARQRDKCLITRSEKRRFQVLLPTRDRTGPLRRDGKASGLKPGFELRVCNPCCRCDCES
jgi:hypothetical protein